MERSCTLILRKGVCHWLASPKNCLPNLGFVTHLWRRSVVTHIRFGVARSYPGHVEYLSPEWITAAQLAVAGAAADAPASQLVIDQHVTDHVSYRVTVAPSGCSLEIIEPNNDATTADASFRQDIATARSIATGGTDAHQAFLLGHIRFDGDINVLIEQRAVFEWLQHALAPVMATTTF